MQGTAVYVPEKDAMMWKIKNFPGGREFLMRCRFALPSVAAEEVPAGRMPPIRVNFEIPYLTVSGIQVCVVASACSTSRSECKHGCQDLFKARCQHVVQGAVASGSLLPRRTNAGLYAGEVSESHREERVPGAALGALHHHRRGVRDPHGLSLRAPWAGQCMPSSYPAPAWSCAAQHRLCASSALGWLLAQQPGIRRGPSAALSCWSHQRCAADAV